MTPAVPPGDQPKGLRDGLVTATPVILTLLATTLAGLSSGEMIRAQYHRSLAAQHQSKAADQWAFFQAKRIRSSLALGTVDALPAPPGPVDPAELQAVADRLTAAVRRTHQESGRLRSVAGAADIPDAVRRAAEALYRQADNASRELDATRARLAESLGREDVRAALAFLGTDSLPPAERRPWETAEIRRALEAARAHPAEEEMAPLLAAVAPGGLDQAVRTAEANAFAFDEAGKRVERVLNRVDPAVRRFRVVGNGVRRGIAALLATLPARPTGRLADAAAGARRADGDLRRALDAFRDYLAARDDYTARREDREARNNQETAGLYELRVYQSGITSERHRGRSKNFFYGMLFAQAGAAIGSLALAARRRSTLWALAGVAGAVALAFSAYVYWWT